MDSFRDLNTMLVAEMEREQEMLQNYLDRIIHSPLQRTLENARNSNESEPSNRKES